MYGRVAQLGERHICNVEAAGAIPVTSTKFINIKETIVKEGCHPYPPDSTGWHHCGPLCNNPEPINVASGKTWKEHYNNRIAHNGMRAWVTKMAVRWLCRELRNDPGYWIAYKANIAMAMYDQMSHQIPTSKRQLHADCNEGADRFLKLWTRE